jgi:hypothetical protein
MVLLAMSTSPESPAPKPDVASAGMVQAGRPAGGTGTRTLPWFWGAVLPLALAAAAGILAWGIGERTHDMFHPSAAAYRSRYDFSILNREQAVANRKNAALAFGTLGAAVGLFLAVSGGLGRQSVVATSFASLAGLIAGGLGAGAAGFALAPVFTYFYSDASPNLLLPVLVRGGICAVVGIAAGLAFGLGRRTRSGLIGAIGGGLVGALLGIVVFEVVNGFLFPSDRNDKLIPTSSLSRFLAYVCVALAAGAGALLLGRDQPKSRAAEPASPVPQAGQPQAGA